MTPVDLVDVTIRSDMGMIPCVLTMAESVSRGQGMDEGSLLRMRLNLEEILLGLISYGLSFGHDPRIDLCIRREGDELVYSVKDKGIPFDYGTLECCGYADIARILTRSDVAPELRNLGRDGREQTFRLPVPGREEGCPDEVATGHCYRPEDFTIHDMDPSECMQVSQCLYDEFGYSYVNDTLYDPQRMRAMMDMDSFTPFTAVAPDGEVAGFMALSGSPDLPGTAEMVSVVVKRRFRKCSIMNRLIDNAIGRARSVGLCSVNMEPVAYHPFTQKVSDRIGMTPLAVCFNRVPSDVDTSYGGGNSRRTIFWSAMSFRDTPRTMHLPEEVVPMAELITSGLGIERDISSEHEEPAGGSDIRTSYNPVMSIGRTFADSIGEDSYGILRRDLRDLKSRGCEIAELMINLQDPGAPSIYESAKDLGYFCTGLFPVSSDRDYLMMQNPMSRIFDYSAMETTESFGRLLELVRGLDPEGDL